jgi:lipoprotein NlpI
MLCRLIFSMLLIVAAAQRASASGYDDFARGESALMRDESEGAIADFTAALAAPDLGPALVFQAHTQRARAYLGKDRCGEALADLDSALAIRPGDPGALLLRVGAASCVGKLEAALADADLLVAHGDQPFNLVWRGAILIDLGKFDSAENDFEAYRVKDKFNPYTVLLLEIARSHAGTFDAKIAAKEVRAASWYDTWPAPLLSLFGGETNPDAISPETADGGDDHKKLYRCERAFYIGEWWLIRKDVAAAKPLLQQASAVCAHFTFEWPMAQAELARTQ